MKMRLEKSFRWMLAALLLAGASAVLTGCNDPDPNNRAERPWNSPKSWESGLPIGMTEGR